MWRNSGIIACCFPVRPKKCRSGLFMQRALCSHSYVNGHIFCYFDINKFDECTLKCAPTMIPLLEEQYSAVGAPYNMSHKYWIGVKFNSDMPDSKLRELVRQSYEIVKGR